MSNFIPLRRLPLGAMLLLASFAVEHPARANPTGGTVSSGSASFSSSGSQFNINQSSSSAFINWQSFNIGSGETVNFNQPSASSVTWNYISDPNASSLNGNLNANGYVILQNPNGFTVGGSAVFNTHGLVMTTASTPNLNLSSGGAWTFDAPPPTAKIINYGQINIAGGGSVYLIASDIENNGTISAPGGKIGLYAGEQVLVSMSPDGRGLSAQVTLPQGSVDNNGRLIADAGSIVAQAQTVNQNGLIQANSVQDVNGTIELVAGNSLNLGAGSQITAAGDSTAAAPSAGGSVTIQSGNTFSDQTGSTIDMAGATQGGNGGQVEISAPQMSALQTAVSGQAASGFVGGELTIDPYDLTLDSTYVSSLNSQIVNGGLSQVNVQADHNIELTTLWSVPAASSAGTLSLTAGNNIILDSGTGIAAGNNWTLNLTAGTAYSGTTAPAAGSDGIYLDGNAYLQTQNGDLNLWAANEVQVGWMGSETIGLANSGTGSITTKTGGNINVTAVFGDVNSGSSQNGFTYLANAPYFTASPALGGIATAAGGNVNINAGGNVTSYNAAPSTTAPVSAGDPGIGAFGAQAGDVTINAGGNVYGHYVVVNGTGTINAGQDIGTATKNVSLSLVNGGWNLDALSDIYLQEVRNPNGVFNATTTGLGVRKKPTAGNHLFDYGSQASVSLTAGNGVYVTGYNLPRPNGAVPMLLPPILTINAGAGGVTLFTPNFVDANGQNILWTGNQSEGDITLFPSAYGNLQITTTDGGGLTSGVNAAGAAATLLMSDSGVQQWYAVPDGYLGPALFGPNDHASVPAELNNYNPVVLNISGNMENVTLQLCKLAQIAVGGDMIGVNFYGLNLHAGDVTTINVGGQIFYNSSFTSVTLQQGLPDILQLSQSLSGGDTYLPFGMLDQWYTLLALAVNPSLLNSQTYNYSENLTTILNANLLYPGLSLPNFVYYNPSSKTLTVTGPLSQSGDSLGNSLYSILESGTLYLPVYGPNGLPLLDANGHFVLNPVTWLAPNTATYTDPNLASLDNLNTQSQGKPPLGSYGVLVVGGTGSFNVSASSINLGNSEGILSVGDGGTPDNLSLYSYLAPYITGGANINITAGTLEMPSSTIASLGGGDVNVTCTGIIPGSAPNGGVGVSMDLGSPDLAQFDAALMANSNLGMGIYSSAGGNVTVIGLGTINVDTSRIATFDGGNVFVESRTGDVNAGSGSTISIPVMTFPITARVSTPFEYAYANGIVADTLAPEPDGSLVPGAATQPGNITVLTPQGSIYASLGGILQESLSGNLLPGPTITLQAGTPANGDWSSTAPPEFVGNIDLGDSGAIGGTVNVQATGTVKGLLIASQNANVASQTVGSLTVLAGGTASVSAQGGTGEGITIIGGQGVNASGIGSGATLLGQNVSVNGGAAQSTLGTSAASTATSQAAAQQSTQSAAEQVAGTGTGDDDQKKKKKPQVRKVGRVTVILSTAMPREAK